MGKSLTSGSARTPTAEEWKALAFGWKVVKHVQSNAIVYARERQLLGAGGGQMSRVDSVRFGAFLPFPDGVEKAAAEGITALTQPGGSVKDEEVIAAANRLGLAMVLTGIRHFRH